MTFQFDIYGKFTSLNEVDLSSLWGIKSSLLITLPFTHISIWASTYQIIFDKKGFLLSTKVNLC